MQCAEPLNSKGCLGVNLESPSSSLLCWLSVWPTRFDFDWVRLSSPMAPSRRKGSSKAAAAAAARRQWKVGDLVLAKVKGFPAWPAKV